MANINYLILTNVLNFYVGFTNVGNTPVVNHFYITIYSYGNTYNSILSQYICVHIFFIIYSTCWKCYTYLYSSYFLKITAFHIFDIIMNNKLSWNFKHMFCYIFIWIIYKITISLSTIWNLFDWSRYLLMCDLYKVII